MTLSTCLEYIVAPRGYSGCVANFNGPEANASASTDPAALYRLLQQGMEETNGGSGVAAGPAIGVGQGDRTEGARNAEGKAGVAQSSQTEGTEPLLDYLLGP